jgi:putative ABC transport system ATP-binding protein/lipoprotein-releasing system ATP-binding protein
VTLSASAASELPAASAPHLVGHDLRRSFKLGKRDIDVLRGVSVEIQQGETIFLCGASGAGKTTLLYTLAGLEHPDSGSVNFEKHDLYHMSDRSRARLRNERVGFIFQGYFLLPELTALENVLLPTMIHGTIAEDRAREALELVGLGERLQHLPAELSGGEQQRVAIARALINRPSIIFADEPTGNLDSRTGEAIVELLLNVVRERKTTLVVVTHDPVLAERGDRRLEMRDGVIAA